MQRIPRPEAADRPAAADTAGSAGPSIDAGPSSQAPAGSTGSTTDPQPLSRAAELAQRARALADRTQRLQARFAADPHLGHLKRERSAPDRRDPDQRRADLEAKLARLYGVRKTEQGALFVQPAGAARRIAVAGDFNNWSPDATPLRRNEQLGVFEANVALPAGRHAYRLVIDGQWTTDPHNDRIVLDDRGEPNNIVEV